MPILICASQVCVRNSYSISQSVNWDLIFQSNGNYFSVSCADVCGYKTFALSLFYEAKIKLKADMSQCVRF